ncbi:MAG: efflux RND transporter periplasmic adaptor subunit [Bacteroidia bacterium]
MKIKNIFGIILFLAIISIVGYFSYQHLASKKLKGSNLVTSDIAYYHCGMHLWIHSDKPGKCPVCGMDLTPVYKKESKNEQGVVEISPTTIQDIDVRTEVIKKRKLSRIITTTGIVDYNESTESEITTKFSGYIEKLFVDYTGQSVQKGQALFTIYSPELVAAEQEYLQAIQYKNTIKIANDTAIIGQSDNLVQSAKKKLLLWDISPEQIRSLASSRQVKKSLTIYAPISGTVIQKNILEGMQIQAGMSLFQIADLSKMWMYADIFENDLPWIKTGEAASITLPNDSGEVVDGKISYIYPFVQQQTRTVKARIEISNKNIFLKKDMYVSVSITPKNSINTVAVPEQAVIHSGTRNIVVLALGKGKFKPVNVTLGLLANGYYAVKSGIQEGDTIVTSSQFLIDSESNLTSAFSSMQGMPGMSGMQPSKSDSTKK